MGLPDLPLNGCRVLDLSDEASVFATRLLVDLGADVVRIESPEGDSIRTRGPFVDSYPGPERSFQHLLFNAGKRSVTVDLTAIHRSELAKQVAAWADIVVAPLNKTPSMETFLDSDRIAREHPHLGVIDLCFQRENSAVAGSDLTGVASGGFLWLNGFPSDPPNYPAGLLAYKQASLVAAFHAVVALLSAVRGRRPTRVLACLQEAVISTTLQSGNQNAWAWQKRSPGRTGGGAGGGPSVYQGSDGGWVSFVIPPPYWHSFIDWVYETSGQTNLRGEEWASPQFRLANAKVLSASIAELCSRFTAEDLAAKGQARHLLVCPVNTIPDLVSDPHLVARAFYSNVTEPSIDATVALPQSPFRFDGTPSPTRAAPRLCEHIGRLDPGHPRTAHGGSTTSGEAPTLPLAGVRVLDFCWLIAGPLGTRLLADLGAEVIKVESSARLDRIREGTLAPPSGGSVNTAPVFNDCNTNKLSIRLNLGTPEGISLAKRLAAKADVVTSNFTPDRMDRWGLGYEDLSAINPKLIVASLPVMGKHGPRSSWGAYGNGVIAMSGISSLTGFEGRPPVGLGTLHSDFTAPYMFAMQIVAALVQRERVGRGQFLELAQYESAVALLDTELSECLNGLPSPRRAGNRSRFQSPHGVFPCSGEDSWIAFSVTSDDQWLPLCTELNRTDLGERQELKTLEGRKRHEDEIEDAVSQWTRELEPKDAVDRLRGMGIAAAAVARVEDLCESPVLKEFFVTLSHPECGSILTQHQPVTYDDKRLPLRRAPLFGEHTQDVLSNLLDMSELGVSELIESGVLS